MGLRGGYSVNMLRVNSVFPQSAITCSSLTIETQA